MRRSCLPAAGVTSITLALTLVRLLTSSLSAADVPATSTPKRGGTLRTARPTDWRSLDPAIGFDTGALPFQRLLFRGLLDYDEGVNLVPDQARDWSLSDDDRTYTFHLRPGIRFAHGREVEAEDYVFSLERVLDSKTGSPGQSYFSEILGVKEFQEGKASHVRGLRAPARDMLVIELEKPEFTFRYKLAMPFAYALPREVVRQYTNAFQYHLIGSGAYRVTDWQRGVRWRFERNPHFTGSGGFVDAVEIMIGGDLSLHAMMFERGELDFVMGVAPADVPRIRRDPIRRSTFESVPMAGTEYLFFNTELKPFNDVRVRRAVNHAINKRRLLKLASDLGTVAKGILPPSIPGHDPATLPDYEYDPEKSRALLREAGFPDGFTTQLWFVHENPVWTRVVASIEQDLHRVGITAELKGVSYAAFEVVVRTRRRAPCGYWGWAQDYPDASNFLDVLLNGERLTETDGNNVAFYNNPEVNRLLAEAGRRLDSGERSRLYHQAERLIMADAPWVPTVHIQQPILKQPWLRGFKAHPVWLWRYETMWLEK